ncbi:hypothetical protein LNQ03_07755 [Klebsiella pneumoniae subsp. pneumoniae]|nr:hypothetical protein [Klebsiella pneumoniae subsp. pneumoniae]
MARRINKPLFDFGDTFSAWSRYSKNKSNHPLIKIIESRIIATLKRLMESLSMRDIWSKYFKGNFHGKDFREFALDQTWYRPRDLVRLMEVALKSFKNVDAFYCSAILMSQKNYMLQRVGLKLVRSYLLR